MTPATEDASAASPDPPEPTAPSLAARLVGLPRVAWAGLAVIWAAGIFALSSLPGDALGPGHVLLSFAFNLAHAPLFGGLAALVGFAGARRLPVPILDNARMLGSLVLVLAYAASDEWHQSAVAGRAADVRDLVTDGAGAWGALVVVAAVCDVAAGRRPRRGAAVALFAAATLAVASASAATWSG